MRILDPLGGHGSPTIRSEDIPGGSVKKNVLESPRKPTDPAPGNSAPGPNGKRTTTGSVLVAVEKSRRAV